MCRSEEGMLRNKIEKSSEGSGVLEKYEYVYPMWVWFTSAWEPNVIEQNLNCMNNSPYSYSMFPWVYLNPNPSTLSHILWHILRVKKLSV